MGDDHDHQHDHPHDHPQGTAADRSASPGSSRPGHDSRPDALPDWVAAAGAVPDWQRSIIAPRADLAVLPAAFVPLDLRARPGVLGYVADFDGNRMFVAATRLVRGEVVDDAVRQQLARAIDADAAFAATLEHAIADAAMYLGVILDGQPTAADPRLAVVGALAEALDAVVMDGHGRLVG
ncbi:MAG: hypothetical protein GX868_18555 [Actinobacteria bacterium]|nr:hypothetical protein [Actinomycetota bacterium]